MWRRRRIAIMDEECNWNFLPGNVGAVFVPWLLLFELLLLHLPFSFLDLVEFYTSLRHLGNFSLFCCFSYLAIINFSRELNWRKMWIKFASKKSENQERSKREIFHLIIFHRFNFLWCLKIKKMDNFSSLWIFNAFHLNNSLNVYGKIVAIKNVIKKAMAKRVDLIARFRKKIDGKVKKMQFISNFGKW